MSETFSIMERANVVRSLTNPRKHFDPAYIAELSESAKQHGIIQPLLLRPLPGHRVADTPRNVTHEIVCGECRDRASEVAGILSYPVMIKDLTDSEVLEIQIIENLKRRDLTELEEAEGYEQLMQHSNLNVDQVAEKIGKSRSYVYQRLKLLDLCSEARTSLRDGSIDASRAVLVARIPDHKLQIKAMKEVVAGHAYSAHREPMTFRQAQEHLQRNYMLKLSEASFKITAVDLVPEAGSCKTCTKRTGHDPDLFSDVKGVDVCTDPPCFHKKEEAHAFQQIKEAKAKGQTVIAGKEAQELALSNYSGTKFKGYKRLDSVDDSPTGAPLRKIIGDKMKADGIKPVMIAHPSKKGEMVECIPNEVAGRLLKAVEGQAAAAKQVSAEAKTLLAEKKAKAEAKTKAQFEKEWRTNLRDDAWAAMRDNAEIEGFDIKVHRYLVLRAANNLSPDNAAAICEVLNLGKVSPTSAVIDFAKDTPNPALLHLLIIMQRDCDPHDQSYGGRIANEGLLLVAGNAFGEQLDDVITEIKAELKEKLWPKAQKSPAATAPAARPKEGAGGTQETPTPKLRAPKPKLSAEEATQGIAAAMQGLGGSTSAPEGAVASPAEPAGAVEGFDVGMAVRVVDDTNKLGTFVKKLAGRPGVIKKREPGGGYWHVAVKPGGLHMFGEDQIERVVA